MPVDSSFVVVDDAISPLRKGILLIKDCLGYITYHVVLREPLSEINVLDGRRNPGGSMLQGESVAGEWSAEMNQVITGQHYLTIIVR